MCQVLTRIRLEINYDSLFTFHHLQNRFQAEINSIFVLKDVKPWLKCLIVCFPIESNGLLFPLQCPVCFSCSLNLPRIEASREKEIDGSSRTEKIKSSVKSSEMHWSKKVNTKKSGWNSTKFTFLDFVACKWGDVMIHERKNMCSIKFYERYGHIS